MIYEYAVEPDLVVDWALARAGIYVRQFGMDQRRLVSDFPKDWRGQVFGALYGRFGFDDTDLGFQNAQPYVEAYVQELCEYMVPRSEPANPDLSWLDAALLEHRRWAFKAIVVSSPGTSDCRELVTPEVMNDTRDRRWRLDTISPTAKTGTELAAAMGPLLCVSQQVVLVDPYFHAKEAGFVESFTAIVSESLKRPRGQPVELTVISGVEWARKGGPELTADERVRIARDMHDKAKRILPTCLPAGMPAKFVCVERLPTAADPFHNRYVLTNVGGVILPYGIAASRPGEADSATDDLQPMHRGIYEARWAQYAEGGGIRYLLEPMEVVGVSR